MKNGVTIYGNFIGTETTLAQRTLTYPLSTTLSGDIGTPMSTYDNSYHVVYNPQGLNASAVLDGVLITAGNANGPFPDYDGGGMYNDGFRGVCSPTIRNCAFVGNSTSSNGGGVYNYSNQSGTVAATFTHRLFLNNAASEGGGVVGNFGDNSIAAFTNCSFGDNTGSYGGALYNPADTRTTLINCILFGNGAGGIINGGNGTVVANYRSFNRYGSGFCFGAMVQWLPITACSRHQLAVTPGLATSLPLHRRLYRPSAICN